jgi:hypothetical protein
VVESETKNSPVPALSVVRRYHLMFPLPLTECWTVYPEVRLPYPPTVGAADAPLAVGVTLLVAVPVAVELSVAVPDEVTLVVGVLEDVTEDEEVLEGVEVDDKVDAAVREALLEAVADPEAVEVAVEVGELVRDEDHEGDGEIAVP